MKAEGLKPKLLKFEGWKAECGVGFFGKCIYHQMAAIARKTKCGLE